MRVGLNVDMAVHGGECIDLFHKHPKDYYCLILCDLFMPVKGKAKKKQIALIVLCLITRLSKKKKQMVMKRRVKFENGKKKTWLPMKHQNQL